MNSYGLSEHVARVPGQQDIDTHFTVLWHSCSGEDTWDLIHWCDFSVTTVRGPLSELESAAAEIAADDAWHFSDELDES